MRTYADTIAARRHADGLVLPPTTGRPMPPTAQAESPEPAAALQAPIDPAGPAAPPGGPQAGKPAAVAATGPTDATPAVAPTHLWGTQ